MKFINKLLKIIVNSLLATFNLKIIKNNDDYSKKLALYTELFQINSKTAANSLGCVVFSMDRALQLDGLLRSFFLNKQGECIIKVIYKTTNDEHSKSYQEVKKRFEGKVEFFEESGSFKSTLENVLNKLENEKLFFLVDDIIFTEPFDCEFLSKIDTSKYIFSLRMGNHLNYSYVVDKLQKLPNFIDKNDDYLYWNWSKSEFDWGYPLSVDGHIFSTLEILAMVKYFDFKAPNSFEEILQNVKELFSKRFGMSYKKARILNNPCNKVQNEVSNFHGTMHQNDLLKVWQNGKEIDILSIQRYTNKSVHEDIKFEFKERI